MISLRRNRSPSVSLDLVKLVIREHDYRSCFVNAGCVRFTIARIWRFHFVCTGKDRAILISKTLKSTGYASTTALDLIAKCGKSPSKALPTDIIVTANDTFSVSDLY